MLACRGFDAISRCCQVKCSGNRMTHLCICANGVIAVKLAYLRSVSTIIIQLFTKRASLLLLNYQADSGGGPVSLD